MVELRRGIRSGYEQQHNVEKGAWGIDRLLFRHMTGQCSILWFCGAAGVVLAGEVYALLLLRDSVFR